MIDNTADGRRTDDNSAFGPPRYRVLILYDAADGCNNYYYYRYGIPQPKVPTSHLA